MAPTAASLAFLGTTLLTGGERVLWPRRGQAATNTMNSKVPDIILTPGSQEHDEMQYDEIAALCLVLVLCVGEDHAPKVLAAPA